MHVHYIPRFQALQAHFCEEQRVCPAASIYLIGLFLPSGEESGQ
jgi:hypothetical protein